MGLPDDYAQYSHCAGWKELDFLNIHPTKNQHIKPSYYVDSAVFNLTIIEYKAKVTTFNGAAVMSMTAGFKKNKGFEVNGRGCLSTKFISPMEPGGLYEVSFWTTNGVLSDTSLWGWATNGLGIAFTGDKIRLDAIIGHTTQIQFRDEIMWNPEWKNYTTQYIADSTYNYLSIGFFLSSSLTEVADFSRDPYFSHESHYFFDDISVYRLPNIFGDTVICNGESAKLKAYNNHHIYKWSESSKPDSVISYSSDLTVTPKATTTYVLNPGETSEMKVTVRVIQKHPVILDNDTSICLGEEITLIIPENVSQFQWQDGSTHESVNISQAGNYWIEVFDHHCVSSDTININTPLCECEAIIPNSFTPNSDNLNDVFLPRFGCPVFNYKMLIFNQQGGLVFESDSENSGWDGTFAGHLQSSGNFVFILEYDLADGSKHDAKGKITILR